MLKKKTPFSSPLVGKDLIEYVKEIEHLPREEKARLCGYVSNGKDGAERLNMMKFMNALLDAEGIEVDGHANGSKSGGGRSASYRISVQSNGNLLIGSAYTKQMELQPGDEFEISLGRKHIQLKQLTAGGQLVESES
jgi:hypothetical protein